MSGTRRGLIHGDELAVSLLLGKESASMIMYLRAPPSPPLSSPFLFGIFDILFSFSTDSTPGVVLDAKLHCQPRLDVHICMHWRRATRNCRRRDYNK